MDDLLFEESLSYEELTWLQASAIIDSPPVCISVFAITRVRG